MKYFIAFFLLVISFTVQAQNYGNQYGRNRGGSSIPQAGGNQTASEPEKPDANLISAERADMYEELLEVDGFTKAVLKNYLKDYYASVISVSYNEEILLEDKRKAVELQKKKLEKSLGDILSEEQVKRVMIEEESGAESKKYKKEKKKGKRKKRKGETEN